LQEAILIFRNAPASLFSAAGKVDAPRCFELITHPSSRELKQIACKNPNEAQRALGWMMMMDGKSTSQFIASKGKAKLFTDGILQSWMQC
jgi:hypothetical protein